MNDTQLPASPQSSKPSPTIHEQVKEEIPARIDVELSAGNETDSTTVSRPNTPVDDSDDSYDFKYLELLKLQRACVQQK